MSVQVTDGSWRTRTSWLICTATSIAMCLSAVTSHAQIDEPLEQPNRGEVAELADADLAKLGVIVAPSPGTGVFVVGTMFGGPAERAGIRYGDYIMSVDGDKVATPAELRDVIGKNKPGSDAHIVLWRRGQEIETKVTLAAHADDSSIKQRAWLGVALQPNTEANVGARIERVVPKSPAADAGLRQGDVVVRINGNEVESIEMMIDFIEKLAPKSKVELSVQRGDDEVQITATLGAVEASPWQWWQDAFRIPESLDWRWDRERWEELGTRGIESIEDKLEFLQQELESLREKLDKSPDASDESYVEPPDSNGNPGHNPSGRTRVYRPNVRYYTYRSPRPYYYYDYRTPRYRAVPVIPYQYYYYRGRPYVYRGPNYGPQIGVRVGPYGVEYWY